MVSLWNNIFIRSTRYYHFPYRSSLNSFFLEYLWIYPSSMQSFRPVKDQTKSMKHTIFERLISLNECYVMLPWQLRLYDVLLWHMQSFQSKTPMDSHSVAGVQVVLDALLLLLLIALTTQSTYHYVHSVTCADRPMAQILLLSFIANVLQAGARLLEVVLLFIGEGGLGISGEDILMNFNTDANY